MKITFSGDICFRDSARGLNVAKEVKSLYNHSDFNVVGLEGPICDPTLAPFPKMGPSLAQDASIDELLPFFTHLDCANNHIMDFGYEGVRQTLDYLEGHNQTAIGISSCYPQMYTPAIIEKDGMRVALCCWAEAQYGCCKSEREKEGYAWLFNPICYQQIEKYKKEVDYVILYLHAGLEDEETPLPEWRSQYKTFIDFGADLVVSNHPHMIQGKECYKGKWIYYSLGNLFFNGWTTVGRAEQFWSSLVLECDLSSDGLLLKEHFLTFNYFEVRLADTAVSEHFAELSYFLQPEHEKEYYEMYIEMILRCWNDYYQSYYSYPIWKVKGPVVWWRRLFNKVMEPYAHHCFLPPVSLNKIYHNINIDTHRFAVAGVCAYLSKTY